MLRRNLLAKLAILLLILILLVLFLTSEPSTIGLYSTPFDENGKLKIRGGNFLKVYESLAESTFASYNSLLESKPYDPGLFAWGIHYEVRSYCDMYNLTRDRKWIEKALARTEYLYSFRDVNGDGIPSWGNYNETYGNSRYAYQEYGVWDGVITTAIIEVCQLIYSDPELSRNETLKEIADKYLDCIKQVIDRYHKCWTSLSEDEGFYWDNPAGDVTGPIVNRFGALGITELKLYDILRDEKYLSRPKAMAYLFKKNLKIQDGAYIWTYAVPPSPYLSTEDISHGAIDLEFAILAYKHKLVFNDTDMKMFANTYLKYIWRGFAAKPRLATYVDGRVSSDYSGVSRNWILLSSFNQTIWLFQWAVFNDPSLTAGSSGCFLQGLSQLAIYYPGRESATYCLLREAERLVNEISPVYYLLKIPVYWELDKAIKLYESNDYSSSFIHASKCISMAVNIPMYCSIIYMLIAALIIWIIIQRKIYSNPSG